MAIERSISTTSSSLTITMSGFSVLNGARSFYFYISDSYGGSDSQILSMPGGDTAISCTFYGLDSGTTYSVSVEMEAPSGSTFSYGPYSASTLGNSPRSLGGKTPTIYGSGDMVSASFYGLPAVSSARYMVLTVGNQYNSYTITGTSGYTYVGGLQENTDYTAAVELFFYPWGQDSEENIGYWTQTVNTGYNSGGSLSVSGVTENGCTLTVSGVPGTTKNPRTLYWYGQEGTSGEWELLTTTTATSSAAQTWSTNKLLPLTYYGFKVSVYVGGVHIQDLTASCTTATASGTLAASDATEYSVRLTLSGLITGVSYMRKIKWYYKAASDSNYTLFDKVSSVAQSASSSAVVIDTLASSTSYSFKAEICDSSDRVLGTKTATATTKETVASISVESVTSASVKILVNNLVNVAYARNFEWLYKDKNEVDYMKFDESSMPATDTSGQITKVFKPLTPATYYDFKVHIKKDNLVMKVLTISARTALDNSLVPDTEIEKIEQSIGETVVRVYWDAPAHELGTYYKVQYSTDDENFVDIGSVMTEPPTSGYTSITLPKLDEEYYIQIMSYFEIEGEIASKFSESKSVYTFSVLTWDTPKVKGQPFNLSANEWNKIVNAAKERLEREDVVVEEFTFDPAVAGKKVTAVQFNQLLKAINVFNPHDIEDVYEGSAITADLLNLVIGKINLE